MIPTETDRLDGVNYSQDVLMELIRAQQLGSSDNVVSSLIYNSAINPGIFNNGGPVVHANSTISVAAHLNGGAGDLFVLASSKGDINTFTEQGWWGSFGAIQTDVEHDSLVIGDKGYGTDQIRDQGYLSLDSQAGYFYPAGKDVEIYQPPESNGYVDRTLTETFHQFDFGNGVHFDGDLTIALHGNVTADNGYQAANTEQTLYAAAGAAALTFGESVHNTATNVNGSISVNPWNPKG